MKNPTYLLRAFSLLIALALYSHCMAHPFSSLTNTTKEEAICDGTKENISTFFTEFLINQNNTYTDNRSIKLSDIEQNQHLVWEAWKMANNNFNEQKLIEIDHLKNGKSDNWNIPAGLEPNATMPYYWGSKGDKKPQGGYPLYLYIHGSGNKDQEWATGLKICQMFDDSPSLYFIPQIPNMGNYYRWWQKSKQFVWEKMLRQALVSGDVNPNQIYFFGISEGGYGSQRLASFYADYLAAAGPMAGGEPLKNAPAENCKNIALSLLTGADDRGFYRNKLTQYVKDEFEKLQKQSPRHFIHRIELIPGKQHAIDYSPTTPWLKQYTRNPYPKSISWENFEMDGQYRKGFYNIVVKERSNEDTNSRTYYELDIKENNISLKVDVVTYQTTETDPKWGIELKFAKSYRPATKGKLIIYLSPELVDLSKKINLTVNGKKAFKGKVKPQLKHIINSCATFFDPARLYPAAIEVDIANLQ